MLELASLNTDNDKLKLMKLQKAILEYHKY